MATLTVAVGPRNARTDPETGLRFYRWQGRDLPSVTTIRRMAGIPHGLHQWALGQVIEHVVGHAPEIAERVTSDDPAILALLRRELRAAATAERDLAADLGTRVHDAAASGLDPETVDEELRPRLRQYRHWLQVSGAEPVGVEFQVFNLTHGYAGTVDLLCRMRDGSVYLVDVKTGKGVYAEHVLQLTGYVNAEFVGADDVQNDRLSELLGSTAGIALLHLADDGWEFRRIRETRENTEAFVGLLQFAVWSHRYRDIESLTLAKRSGAAA